MGHDDFLTLPEDELSRGALRLVHRIRVLQALDVTALTAIKPRWCGTAPSAPGTYTAQLRAHGGGENEVTAELVDGTLHVTFTEPARGVAPSQAVVLYDGTRVVGSATIATTVRRETATAATSG